MTQKKPGTQSGQITPYEVALREEKREGIKPKATVHLFGIPWRNYFGCTAGATLGTSPVNENRAILDCTNTAMADTR